MSNSLDTATDKQSVIGPTLVFKGELSSQEDMVIKGRVEGSVRHTADLRIAPEGLVKGDIVAKYVTIEGRIEGDLHASGSVVIRETATVIGNVYAPRVSVIDGARFKGIIDMDAGQELAKDVNASKAKAVTATPPKPALPQKAAVGAN